MKNKEGKYYTLPKVVSQCLEFLGEVVNLDEYDYCLEPSAGTGEFFKVLLPMFNMVVAYDIDPKCDGIIKGDFLGVNLENLKSENTITIGNPPFGFGSNLAVKFFNKCSNHSVAIAFIVPRTFRKVSIHNKLNLDFTLEGDLLLDKESFYLPNNEPYKVPCVFQVWVKDTKNRRQKIDTDVYNNPFLEFTSFKEKEATIVRAGGRSGQLLEDLTKECDGLYYVKVKDGRVYDVLKDNKYLEESREVASNTSGYRSISKYEIVSLIEKYIKKY